MGYKTTVQIWGKPSEIMVYQRSKSVWIATENYLNRNFEGKGSSSGAAVKRWGEVARYFGNDGPMPGTDRPSDP